MGVAPQYVQSCKNIDHDVGALASFTSQCYPSHFCTKVAKFLVKIVEKSPNIKFPGRTSLSIATLSIAELRREQ